jgi:hypothetical protein
MRDPHGDLHPDTPDVPALQRRVLLVALVTVLLFFAATGVITSVGASTVWLLPVMVVIFFGVTRPLMAPVMAAVRLRRRLAYQAFLEQREDPGRG